MSAPATSKRHPRKAPAASTRRPRVRAAGVPARDVPNVEADTEFDAGSIAPFADDAMDELDPNLRHRMVSETAYRRHGECGYEDGYDLEDWLQAEADVDRLLHNPRR